LSFAISPSTDRFMLVMKQYKQENAKSKESSTKNEGKGKGKSILLEKQNTSFNNGIVVSLDDTEDLY